MASSSDEMFGAIGAEHSGIMSDAFHSESVLGFTVAVVFVDLGLLDSGLRFTSGVLSESKGSLYNFFQKLHDNFHIFCFF